MKKIHFHIIVTSMLIHFFVPQAGLCSEDTKEDLPGLLRPSTITQTEYGTRITPIARSPIVHTYDTGSSQIGTITEHADGKYMVPSGTTIGIDSRTGAKTLSDIGTGKDYPLTEIPDKK